jgi:hypothetical protein
MGLSDLVPEYFGLVRQDLYENFNELKDSLKEQWKRHSLQGRAWQVLRTLGGGVGMVTSPIQAAVEEAVGEPLERVTGVPGLAHRTGEVGTMAAQVFADPLLGLVGKMPVVQSTLGVSKLGQPASLVGKGLERVRESGFGQGVEAAVSASTRRQKVPSLVPDPAGGMMPLRSTEKFIKEGPDAGLGVPEYKWLKTPAKFAEIIRRHQTMRALMEQKVRDELEPFQHVAKRMTPEEGINFQLLMSGEPHALSPTDPKVLTGLQPMADVLRRWVDRDEEMLVAVGSLARATGEYWSRQFKDPEKAIGLWEEHERAVAASRSRRPMQGSKGAAGLLPRTVPTLQASLDKGLELKFTNPIDAFLVRHDGIMHHVYGKLQGQEMKGTGIAKFFPWNKEREAADLGMVKLNDKFFEAHLMPAEVDKTFRAEALHQEGFDAKLRKGIEDVAKFLGLDPKRPLRSEDPFLAANPQTQGYASRIPELVAQFGTYEGIMMHEIGHHIEFQYHLADYFKNNFPAAWEGLRKLGIARSGMDEASLLAAARQSPRVQQYYDYLINADERIANLFHAYWHAPELLKQIAPDADKALKDWLALPVNRALRGVVDNVKPSLVTGGADRVQSFEEHFHKVFPGLRYLGGWFAPEQVATVFNNFVSEGFKNRDLVDSMRGFANGFNQLQLGLSFFHLGMVSIENAVSALTMIPRALYRGDLQHAADLGLAAATPLGVYAGVRNVARGREFRRDIMKYVDDPMSLTSDRAAAVKFFLHSGGRVNMDMIHRSNGMGGFLRAWKPTQLGKNLAGKGPYEGYIWESIKETFGSTEKYSMPTRAVLTGLKLASRTIETVAEPIMTQFVPLAKLGVMRDMAREFVQGHAEAAWQEFSRKNPGVPRDVFMQGHPGPTNAEFDQFAQRAWESVDNRMGEMVYDNLFWDRMLKDTSFLAVRAVGWNLGTIRELGGGLADLTQFGYHLSTGSNIAEMTERARYSIALPIVVAWQGAILTYLFTGKGPQGMVDYFYPPTGRSTPEGTKERLAMPTYVKDVVGYNNSPGGTLMNKLHPLWSTMLELYNNKDYYGGAIVSDLDKTYGGLQFGKYLVYSATPFSFRGVQRQAKEHADWFPYLMSFFGFVPAPVVITNPKKIERFEQMQELKDYRRRLKEK